MAALVFEVGHFLILDNEQPQAPLPYGRWGRVPLPDSTILATLDGTASQCPLGFY